MGLDMMRNGSAEMILMLCGVYKRCLCDLAEVVFDAPSRPPSHQNGAVR